MDDRGPEATAEPEGGYRDEDGGRAPDDEARLQRPEGAEAGADHHDESREEGVDVERSDPLAVLAGEGNAAAGAARAHDEVALEELPLAADGASEPETPQHDRAPVALGKGSGPASGAVPGKNGRRAGFHATSMTAGGLPIQSRLSALGPQLSTPLRGGFAGLRRRSRSPCRGADAPLSGPRGG